MLKTILALAASALVLSACMTWPARGAPKVDRVCAELNKQDPSMIRLAADNWHMAPDEAKRHFRSRQAFIAKVRSCRRA